METALFWTMHSLFLISYIYIYIYIGLSLPAKAPKNRKAVIQTWKIGIQETWTPNRSECQNDLTYVGSLGLAQSNWCPGPQHSVLPYEPWWKPSLGQPKAPQSHTSAQGIMHMGPNHTWEWKHMYITEMSIKTKVQSNEPTWDMNIYTICVAMPPSSEHMKLSRDEFQVHTSN